ncbi:MAG TPA: TetR/AcrR family transcriptional regulator [Rhizomicrobium sp.]|nr:TetR/AcrR family transcriptional regulator [Rhizomicrobium sp.]
MRRSSASKKPVLKTKALGARAPRRGRVSAWSNVVMSAEQQFALKRRALMKEAARAFSLYGYEATSLLDIAKMMGVTKAALYHYVKNKQEILFECHLLSHELGNQAIEYANANGDSSLEKIRLLARRYIELLTDEIGSCAVLLEFNALTPENRAVIAGHRDRFERHLRNLVKAALAENKVAGREPKLAVFFLMGAVNWLTRWYRPDGEFDSKFIAAQFADMFASAIAGRVAR